MNQNNNPKELTTEFKGKTIKDIQIDDDDMIIFFTNGELSYFNAYGEVDYDNDTYIKIQDTMNEQVQLYFNIIDTEVYMENQRILREQEEKEQKNRRVQEEKEQYKRLHKIYGKKVKKK